MSYFSTIRIESCNFFGLLYKIKTCILSQCNGCISIFLPYNREFLKIKEVNNIWTFFITTQTNILYQENKQVFEYKKQQEVADPLYKQQTLDNVRNKRTQCQTIGNKEPQLKSTSVKKKGPNAEKQPTYGMDRSITANH